MAMFARWSFSLLLLVVYVATFHVWMHVERAGIVVSGLVSTAVLAALFVRALRRRYFLNGWDAFWHGTVILDLFLEATLVSHHGDFSFYLCALAFVVVVGGYRQWVCKRCLRRADLHLSATGAGGSPPVASSAMNEVTWEKQFRAVFDRGVAAWQAGRRKPATMFDAEDVAFLAGIGCTAQELFDFVDDSLVYGEPDFATALGVQAIRREYLMNEMKGIKSGKQSAMSNLPPKAQEVDGISWLPRLIVKARMKLRGEMPDDLMYGCGGDRPFVRRMNTTLPCFLQLVRDCVSDDRQIVDTLKRNAGIQ